MDSDRPEFIRRINCPRHCGWFREYTATTQWLNRNLDHPILGPVTQREVVQWDCRNHVCHETANAIIRLHSKKENHAIAA